jgi:hypothetical protein
MHVSRAETRLGAAPFGFKGAASTSMRNPPGLNLTADIQLWSVRFATLSEPPILCVRI